MAVSSLLILAALALPARLAQSKSPAPAGANEEPTIDHQPIECSVPGKNTRVCAYVLDDGEVKRVRVYFRADKQDAFYWSDMTFDGIQFCATLPVAKNNVSRVEYYIWAVDDQFQSIRTRSYSISFEPTSPCAYPVVDDDPERISKLVVHATAEKQGDEIEQFEKQGIAEFVAAKK